MWNRSVSESEDKDSDNYTYGGGYNYSLNSQYNAYLSTFRLNERDADVVFVGDSITARGRFSELFPDVNVLNRGIGSDVSEGVLNRIDEVILHKPKIIVLMIGINDLGYKIDENAVVGNVRKTLEQIHVELPDCNVYLMSVLPVETLALAKVKSLNVAYRQIAAEYDFCTYIDLYSSFMENEKIRAGLLCSDGVHLNGAGYALWADSLREKIE